MHRYYRCVSTLLAAGPLRRLHLDKAAVGRVSRGGRNEPCISIRQGDGPVLVRAFVVRIQGPSIFLMRMEAPLQPEGTYAWVETNAAVEYL